MEVRRGARRGDNEGEPKKATWYKSSVVWNGVAHNDITDQQTTILLIIDI
jgi:hypothetical protein